MRLVRLLCPLVLRVQDEAHVQRCVAEANVYALAAHQYWGTWSLLQVGGVAGWAGGNAVLSPGRRATGRAVGALEAGLLVGAFLISRLQSAGLATPGRAHSTLPPLDRVHSDPCPRSCPPCSLGSGPLVLH